MLSRPKKSNLLASGSPAQRKPGITLLVLSSLLFSTTISVATAAGEQEDPSEQDLSSKSSEPGDAPLIGFHPPTTEAEGADWDQIRASVPLEVFRASVESDSGPKSAGEWFPQAKSGDASAAEDPEFFWLSAALWTLFAIAAIAGLVFGLKKLANRKQTYDFPEVKGRLRFGAPYSGGNNAHITFRKRRSSESAPSS